MVRILSAKLCSFLLKTLVMTLLHLPGSAFGQSESPQTDTAQTAQRAELIIVDAGGHEYRLTEQAFNALPGATIVTHTAWTEGAREFTGVLVRDVLSAAGIERPADAAGSVEALALNDYRVLIPMTDFYDYDVLIAREMDGTPMTRRGKGPYWIVYPRDDFPELAESQYDHRWTWQLWQLRVQ